MIRVRGIYPILIRIMRALFRNVIRPEIFQRGLTQITASLQDYHIPGSIMLIVVQLRSVRIYIRTSSLTSRRA